MSERVNVNTDLSFTRKISVLHESSSLLNEEDFKNIRNMKTHKDKLEQMSNVSYYITADDLAKVINSDKKVYLRLVIDPPYRCGIDGNEEIMSISDSQSHSLSPGRNKSFSSKSSDSIKVKKSKKTTRLTKSDKNIDLHKDKKIISIKSKTFFLYFEEDEEIHSVFLCNMKDSIIYCNFINDDDIKGSKLSKLLTYESTDVNIGDKIITISSCNIKNLTFPIYFVLQKHVLSIKEFTSIMQNILDSI